LAPKIRRSTMRRIMSSQIEMPNGMGPTIPPWLRGSASPGLG
jgi:hypothetical protein